MKRFHHILLVTILLLAGSVMCISNAFAQANVGINTTTPNASALLDLTDTAHGLLVPRMTTTQKTAITGPATGLLVFDQTLDEFYYWNATAWTPFLSLSSGWSTVGNSGTVAGTNFLGTTDNVGFEIRTNNVAQVAFTATGYMGIASLTPTRPLEVVGDNATGYTVSFRTASSETGVLFGCADDNSTYGSVQAYTYSNGTRVAANLALEANAPGPATGDVGIGMTTTLPATKLDIFGDLALRQYDTTAVDTTGAGSNNNYNVRGHTFVRITGPTHEFIITGISGGTNGRIVTLFNATPTLTSHTGQKMVIANQSSSSSSANQILTLSGANIVCTSNSAVSMIYSTAENEWIVFSVCSN